MLILKGAFKRKVAIKLVSLSFSTYWSSLRILELPGHLDRPGATYGEEAKGLSDLIPGSEWSWPWGKDWLHSICDRETCLSLGAVSLDRERGAPVEKWPHLSGASLLF